MTGTWVEVLDDVFYLIHDDSHHAELATNVHLRYQQTTLQTIQAACSRQNTQYQGVSRCFGVKRFT